MTTETRERLIEIQMRGRQNGYNAGDYADAILSAFPELATPTAQPQGQAAMDEEIADMHSRTRELNKELAAQMGYSTEAAPPSATPKPGEEA